MHHTVPRRLNSRCPIAVRFAATFPLIDARIGVIVVPIFEPSTSAHARSKVIHPFVHIISVIANVAADDCITIVNTMPTARNINIEDMPIVAYSFRKANISGLLCRSGTYSDIMSRPMKRNEKPTRNSPIDFVRPFLENSSGTARPMRGRTNADMLTLNPNRAITHAVNVVPTFAPKITAIDWARVIRPALTKLTTITVDADELWINAVIAKPVIVPVKRLRVIADRMLRKRSPAAFWSPSLITFMPYRNNPTDPIRHRKSKKL